MPPSFGRKRPSTQTPRQPPRRCAAQIIAAERARKGIVARARRSCLRLSTLAMSGPASGRMFLASLPLLSEPAEITGAGPCRS